MAIKQTGEHTFEILDEPLVFDLSFSEEQRQEIREIIREELAAYFPANPMTAGLTKTVTPQVMQETAT